MPGRGNQDAPDLVPTVHFRCLRLAGLLAYACDAIHNVYLNGHSNFRLIGFGSRSNDLRAAR